MKHITLTTEDTRFGLDCAWCGYPFDPGDRAVLAIDDDGPVCCSKRCAEEWMHAETRREQRMAKSVGL